MLRIQSTKGLACPGPWLSEMLHHPMDTSQRDWIRVESGRDLFLLPACSFSVIDRTLAGGSPELIFMVAVVAADTIYALSSGSGKAGVAVVRISGSAARSILKTCCGKVPAPRRASRVCVHVNDGSTKIDDALVLWFPSPASFTGEDVAEVHLHGSIGIVRMFLAELGSLSGVRPAEPGEFTRRALAYGKMDLVEVEGLGDMLEAGSSLQVEQALFHVDGRASEIFIEWRRRLTEASALAEACIDFSDEEGVADAALPKIRDSVSRLIETLREHLADSERGRLNREGVRVVIVGAPNAGKSSLLNALAARDAAIVSNEPGTTRDVVEVSLDLDGIMVSLCDTAGLRDQVDSHAEQLGIERTYSRIDSADVILSVASPDTNWQKNEIDSPTLRIWNKADIRPPGNSDAADIVVSAKSGDGIGDLLLAISRLSEKLAGGREPSLLARERQVRAVTSCISHLEHALSPGLALEILAEDLRMGATDLARLVGLIDVEDLLDEIFASFCIGK
jgi:tRNA modification GTPase